MLYPPQLSAPIVVTKTYRFVASAAVTSRALTVPEVLDLLCMASAANAAYRIGQSIKIKSIEIWAVSPALDVPVTVSFQFTSATTGLSGPSILKSDTSMGFDRAAHLLVKTKDREQSGQWQDLSVTGVYGILTCPKGSVVDFTYTMSVADVAGGTAVAGAVAGATTGAVYLRALDNSQATPLLIPASLPTI